MAFLTLGDIRRAGADLPDETPIDIALLGDPISTYKTYFAAYGAWVENGRMSLHIEQEPPDGFAPEEPSYRRNPAGGWAIPLTGNDPSGLDVPMDGT